MKNINYTTRKYHIISNSKFLDYKTTYIINKLNGITLCYTIFFLKNPFNSLIAQKMAELKHPQFLLN